MTVIEEIADLDKTISMIREIWLDVKPEWKDKYVDRLNKLLDERSRLMKLRDAQK